MEEIEEDDDMRDIEKKREIETKRKRNPNFGGYTGGGGDNAYE